MVVFAVTEMTFAKIDEQQLEMLRHPKNSWNSSAIGRYQIIRTTLHGLKKGLGLDESQKFTSEMQDLLAIELLRSRGYEAWKNGPR